MINVNDLKSGMTIQYDGNIYIVIDYQHVKPGKGAAFVQAKLKNLRSGAREKITCISLDIQSTIIVLK